MSIRSRTCMKRRGTFSGKKTAQIIRQLNSASPVENQCVSVDCFSYLRARSGRDRAEIGGEVVGEHNSSGVSDSFSPRGWIVMKTSDWPPSLVATSLASHTMTRSSNCSFLGGESACTGPSDIGLALAKRSG